MTDKIEVKNSDMTKIFGEYIGLKSKLNVKNTLGVKDEIMERELKELFEVCKAIIEEKKLYNGEDIDGFIFEYMSKGFDKRYEH